MVVKMVGYGSLLKSILSPLLSHYSMVRVLDGMQVADGMFFR